MKIRLAIAALVSSVAMFGVAPAPTSASVPPEVSTGRCLPSLETSIALMEQIATVRAELAALQNVQLRLLLEQPKAIAARVAALTALALWDADAATYGALYARAVHGPRWILQVEYDAASAVVAFYEREIDELQQQIDYLQRVIGELTARLLDPCRLPVSPHPAPPAPWTPPVLP
jgi:hypothetical protein